MIVASYTHLVAFHAVESLAGALKSPEDVAAADDDSYFNAGGGSLLDLAGIDGKPLRVYAVALCAHQRLAAELEQYPFVFHFFFHQGCCGKAVLG